MAKRINLTLSDFGMTRRGRKKRLRRIANIVLAEWGAEARKVLGTTLQAYLRSLSITQIDENSAVVSLPGEHVPQKTSVLARMMEFGLGGGGIGTTGSFDMRRVLLSQGTKSLRTGKSGPYLRVPFGHQAKSIRAMGGNKAINAARKLKASVDTDNAKTNWGGRLRPGMSQKLKPHHKSDPLQGLVRLSSTYKAKKSGKARTQNTYRTWRTASWAGQAWTHPGIKPRLIGDKVRRRLPDILAEVL